MARTRKTVTTELREVPDDEEDEKETAEPRSDAPLFISEEGEAGGENVLHDILVLRLKPIREGNIGYLDPDATEEDIFEEWGGGRFRLIGRTARGKPIAGKFRTVQIGGDPIFISEEARAKWRRMQGTDAPSSKAPAAATADPDSVAENRHRRRLEEIRAEAAANLEKTRTEAAAREEAEDRRRARETAASLAAEERRDKAAREEREREREERRQDREAQAVAEDRRWKAEMDERRAEREARQDPTTILMQGMKLAMDMGAGGGGEGFPDAGTALIAKLPEIMQEARGIAVDVAADAGSKRDKARTNPRGRGSAASGEPVTLDGELGARAKRAAERLMKAGRDPEKVMGAALAETFDRLERQAAAATKQRKTPIRKDAPKKPAAPTAHTNGVKGNGAKPPATKPKPSVRA